MTTSIKSPFNKSSRTKCKGTVASLCIVCSVFFVMLMASGCRESSSIGDEPEIEEPSVIDKDAFIKIRDEAPVAFVPFETLPEWIQERINGHPNMTVHRGIWTGRTVFLMRDCFMDRLGDFAFENREVIEPPLGNLFSESKNWTFIFQKEQPVDFVPFETLPEWIQDELNNFRALPYGYMRIHRGIWKNRAVCFVFDSYMSYYGYFRYENGDIADFSQDYERTMLEYLSWPLIFIKEGKPCLCCF